MFTFAPNKNMKLFTLLSMLLVPMTISAQKQYLLPTGDSSMDEKEKPLIEVYLPKQELANGCASVLRRSRGQILF